MPLEKLYTGIKKKPRKRRNASEVNLDIIIEDKVCSCIFQKQPESIVVCKVFELHHNPPHGAINKSNVSAKKTQRHVST